MNNVTINGSLDGEIFLFAHGAGAGMDHPFMESIATQLAQHGVGVIRFDFPYMVLKKELGKQRPPDRAPKLLEAFQSQIDKYANGSPIYIGGKSMGGRMASLLADHPLVKGIACLGFPFHPPGRPEKFKGDHLASVSKPTLILQGERDTFGTKEEMQHFSFSPSVSLDFLADGDHSFKPRKASGVTEAQNLSTASSKLAHFILGER